MWITWPFTRLQDLTEGERGKIQYIAKVRGHELTTRGELLKDEKDHPRANEEYYKIQIGPLIRLAEPIKATNWKRITFLYTTGKSLMEASRVNDLVIRSEERSLLWRSIRERIGSDNLDVSSTEENLDIPEGQLLEILGYLGFNELIKTRILIYCEGLMKIIKNGTLITASETFSADILISGEKITEIGSNINIPGAEIIDANGMFVMPGRC